MILAGEPAPVEEPLQLLQDLLEALRGWKGGVEEPVEEFPQLLLDLLETLRGWKGGVE